MCAALSLMVGFMGLDHFELSERERVSAIPKTKKKKTNEIKINREIERKTKEEGRVITTATIGGGTGVCRPVIDDCVRGSLSF